jgi:hypothetical protein
VHLNVLDTPLSDGQAADHATQQTADA